MRPAVTICVAVVVAATVLAGPPADGPPASRPAGGESLLEGDSLLDDGGLLDEASVPVTLPSIVDRKRPVRKAPKLREGVTIFDRRGELKSDKTGKWWIVPDAKAGQLYLLPCELLATEGPRVMMVLFMGWILQVKQTHALSGDYTCHVDVPTCLC